MNFRCPHLTHYSLAGGAKRDYPASIRDHSPWWPHYREVEDYFARLSVMLTQGTPVRDVLVLHTVESGWGLPNDAAGGERIKALEEQLEGVIYALSNGHFDWDFGDESLMAKYAEIDGEQIRIGEMSYRLIVVPPSITLRSSTMELLEAFVDGGGEVLFVGDVAERVDAEPDGRPTDLAARTRTCCCPSCGLIATVEDILPRRVAVTEDGEPTDFAWSMMRKVDGGQVLFIDSHDREEGHSVRVQVEANAPVVEWDPRTGQRREIPAWEADGMLAFDVWLEPTGSALFTLGVEVEDAEPYRERMKIVGSEEIGGPFEIELSEPNTLPLDYCRFRVEDEDWSEPVPVLKADELIRARYDLGKRFGSNHQPWYLYKTGVVDTAPREHCELRWNFHVTDVPSQCHLALENPEDYVITVNGSEVSEVDGCWVDDDIETIDIAEHVQEGDNEILLSFTYRPTMEIEDGYLLGDFGVATRDGDPRPGSMTITQQPETLEEGSWVGQGLDTYGGAVRYTVSVEKPAGGKRVRLSLPELSCTAAVIHAGGEQWVLPWAPFAADITDALQDGENEVVVEVIGGRHNIFGPLHTPWEAWTGPGEFDPDNNKWRFEYYLNDHGLMGPVVVATLEEA